MGSSSCSPAPGSRDTTGVPSLLLSLPPLASSACLDEGNVALATRRWAGWEEEVALEEGNGRHIVYYYLRRTSPRGGGSAENELAIVGALREPSQMQYVVNGPFLQSLEASVADRAGASPRLVAAAEEASRLRWRSRKEVMDWLTSLVSGYPYGSSSMDNGFDEYPPGDHDGDVANTSYNAATKGLSLTLARNNLEDFTWFGPVHRPDERRKHYKSFRLGGSTISVHDFVYIKRDDKDRHVAYVEDMYDDINTGCIVMVRWFDKVNDDHGVVLPPDVNNREVFFSYGMQDLRVEWVENGILGPFDITELQGYSNQEILRTLVNASSSMKAPTKNEPSTDGGHKRKRDAIDDQAIKNHARSDVVTDPTIANHSPHDIINDQISITYAPHRVIDEQLSKTHAPRSVPNDQTVENHAHSNTINGKIVGKPPPHSQTNYHTIQNHGHRSVIIGKTMEIPSLSNATNGRNPEKCPSHNATNDKATEKHPPSRGSGSGLIKSVSEPNTEQLFQPGCHIEVLSQDSTMRGCWFRCLIIKRKEDLIKVQYQDIKNDDKTENVKEWLKLSRIANPDKMSIRISGRPRIRPQLPQKSKIPSTVASGTIVDAWWHDGWWEGIVMQQETVGLIRVYFLGENRSAEFRECDLRRSFEWVDSKWTPLMERKDILCRLLGKDQGNQIMPQESALHAKPNLQKASLQLNMGGNKSARPEGQNASPQLSKGDEKSSKPMASKPLLQSDQKDGGISTKPAVLLKTSLQLGVPTKPAVQKTSLQYGAPAKQVLRKPSLQLRMKGVDESAKPYPQKTIMQSSLPDLNLHSGKKDPQEPARLTSGKLILRTSEKGPQEPARPSSGKLILQTSEKSPQKLLETGEKGNGTPVGENIIPYHKRSIVDLTDDLKSGNLKWAERKVRGYCGPMGPLENTNSQEDTSECTPSGGILPVNSVPNKEICVMNRESHVGTMPMPNLFISKWKE